MAVGIATMTSLMDGIRKFGDWAVSVESDEVLHHDAEDVKILQLMRTLDSFKAPSDSEKTTNLERVLSKIGKPFLYFFVIMLPIIAGDAALFYFEIFRNITGPLGGVMVLSSAFAYFAFLFANSLWPFAAVAHFRQYDSQLRAVENAQFLHQASQLRVFALPVLKEGKHLIEILIKRKRNWLRNCVGGSGKIALLIVLLAADRLFANEQKLSQIAANTTELLISAAILGVVIGSFPANAAIGRLVYQQSLITFAVKRRKKKARANEAC